MNIPSFLSHLPVYQGLPVPFAQMWFDGVPDFRVIDYDKVLQCVNDHLCGLCGTRMGRTAWFVGGSGSLKSGFFMDPPMHEHCARFAISTCPYLSGKVTEHNTIRPVKPFEGGTIEVCHQMATDRPEKIGMRRALKYHPHRHCGSNLIVVARWYGQPVYLA